MKRGRILFLLPLIASLCGCATGGSARYYTLVAVHPSGQETQAFRKGESIVAIGPVTLPDYVDRPGIVTRSAGGEVNIAEFDRWAGPLEDEVTRVLVEDVAAAFRPEGLAAVSWRQRGPRRLNIPVTIVRLDAVPGRSVQINVQWSIRGIGPDRDTRFYQESFEAPAPGPGYRSIVDGISRALAGLADRIARTAAQSLKG